MFSKFSITWLKDQNDWWSCTFFLYVLTTLAARDWAVAKWERGTWDGIFYFVFLYFVFLYLMFLYFLLLYFASANDWATARWETDFVLLYFATSYLAASDWAIARWEAGDLSCARTEEGFVIRVTNEAGQPSSLFIVIIDNIIIIIAVIAMTSGVLWHLGLLAPIFWAVPCYKWKGRHVRVEGEHITTLNDQTKTGSPETGKQWWRCK